MDPFLLFMFRVCHAVLSVHCRLFVTCWERANLLALVYVMFSCVFVTLPCGVLGQMWYLIVQISDILLSSLLCFVFSQSASTHNAAFPTNMGTSVKIRSKLANWLQIYASLIVWTGTNIIH